MTISTARHRAIPAHITSTLERAQRTREAQLQQLPHHPDDLVLAAHRASVERILADIVAARRLLSAGDYGTCTGCHDEIPVERLELRPWTTACVRCAGR